MRRRRAVVVGLVALALLVAGCSSVPAGYRRCSRRGPHRVVLWVGDQKGGVQSLLRAANLLAGTPYRIEWTTFTAGPPLIEVARSGAIDIGQTGNTPVIFAAAAQARVQLVAASQGNVVSDAILVPRDSPIRTVTDLRGTRIAVGKGTSAHGQLLETLRAGGMTLHDVDPRYCSPATPMRRSSRARSMPGDREPVHRAGPAGVRRPGRRHGGRHRQRLLVRGGEQRALATHEAGGDRGRPAPVDAAMRFSDTHREERAVSRSQETGCRSPSPGSPCSAARTCRCRWTTDWWPRNRSSPTRSPTPGSSPDGSASPRSPTAAPKGGMRPGELMSLSRRPHPFTWRSAIIVPTGSCPPPATPVASSPPPRLDRAPARPRRVLVDYLAQIARAAEHLGFAGVLTPTGTFCEDAWITTAALLLPRPGCGTSSRSPGLISPTLAAQQASTYQRVSGGRLLLNVVTGGDAAEQRASVTGPEHDRRYARTDEFLTSAGRGRPIRSTSRRASTASPGPTMSPARPDPAVYFGGSSDAALPVAARHADVYLTWGEPPRAGRREDRAGPARHEAGRAVRFGIRLHVITRDTAERRGPRPGVLDALDPAE